MSSEYTLEQLTSALYRTYFDMVTSYNLYMRKKDSISEAEKHSLEEKFQTKKSDLIDQSMIIKSNYGYRLGERVGSINNDNDEPCDVVSDRYSDISICKMLEDMEQEAFDKHNSIVLGKWMKDLEGGKYEN